ncbi:hypothetical protein HUJ05_005446 [Dendroctonus ponderosae]|nr:hypothetical protein HUJ05_005446 [Dendroctonus ponderosae]
MSEPEEEQRPKRQKRDTSYKAKAFERFKRLKEGNRSKYEVGEVDSIYETVDEREYENRVLNRQGEDWIVDDDGSGYVEDGREIFDDDLDAESISKAAGKGKGVKRKKAVSDPRSKGNLKCMLANISGKKKEETQIEDDNTLAEILGEMDDAPSTSSTIEVKPFVPRKQVAQDYFKKFESRKVNPPREAAAEAKPHVPIEAAPKSPEPLPVAEDIKPAPAAEEDEFEDDLDLSRIEEIEAHIPAIDDKKPLKESPDLFPFFANGCSESESTPMEVAAPFVVDNSEVFRFFWWDAFEDVERHRGTVFLFGKTYCKTSKAYVSCCVAIQNINRQIFLQPRPFMLDEQGKPTEQPVTYKDLYCEFSTLLAEPMHIKTFKARLVQKKYAFDPTVPRESDYLEVRYSGTYPKVNLDVLQSKPKSFCRVFGLNASFLELFLLDAKIKGPCWLDVKSPEVKTNPLSWCKVEVGCSSISNVVKVEEAIPPPPLVVTAISIRQHINAQTHQNEVLMISCVTQTSYAIDKQQPTPPFNQHFCVIAVPSQQPLPLNMHEQLQSYKGTRVQKMNSEKALLNYFAAQFSKIDPDLIVGHGLKGFQVDVLANRLTRLDIAAFSKFSRLRRTVKKKLALDLFTGRLVADIKISAKELIKSRSYDLPSLCQQVLKIPESQLMDLEPDEVVKMFDNVQDLIKLISFTMKDTACCLKILYDLNIVPLALQITNIAGNVMSRTLMGGRSERNEYLLLHAFHEKGFIVPDKQYGRKGDASDPDQATRKKATYSGGLVLDPKVGFYDKFLLLMDFNSLYPSIIQEYNICFTTLPVSLKNDALLLPDQSLPLGILPIEIRKLVDSRKQVKSLMNASGLSQEQKMLYHIRQMALKLTANSMYGCLGFSHSRFYARNLAALVTQKGREILTNTKDLVERMCLEVVYGDTDSIMINTNLVDFDEVLKIGHKVKQEVNKLYKMVELDIDGIFKYLLLLKKKKYAAVTLSRTKDGQLVEEKEYKGLDIVRRDWSQLACEAGRFILEHIFSDQSEDDRLSHIRSYLRKLQEDLTEGRVPLQLLVITKQLVKDPTMYANKAALPHVQVALRYNRERGGHFREGDTIPYIICEDGTSNSASQRAFHPEELKLKDALKVDTKYYLAHQIHPVVARICDPIQGIDAYQIAECLGMDPTSFKKPVVKAASVSENITRPEVRYRDVEKFSFQCLSCKATNCVTAPMKGDVPFLASCTNESCQAKPLDYLFYVQNQLTCTIRRHIQRYYDNKLICEDPSCPNEIRSLPLRFAGKYPVCTMCKQCVMFRDYTEHQLYCQLSYFVYLFDIGNLEKKFLLEEAVSRGFQQLRQEAERFLNASSYSVVNLQELFDFVLGRKESPPKTLVQLETTQPDLFYADEDDEAALFGSV